MILNLWKYLQGYVIIRVNGFAPERFINLCANRNIYIWNVYKVSDGYIFSISKKAFFLLAPIAHKTKCRVKIVKKKGIPFKLKVFKKRKQLLVGLVLSICIIIALSCFVWRIEVVGNIEYSTDEIMSHLKSHGIFVGLPKFKIDCSDLDDLFLADFEKMMWVSSELKGTKLEINIREGVSTKYEPIDERTCDLVATKDGTVISIITRKGTPMVKAGDSVKTGDILVSGTLEIKELTVLKAVNFTYSDADIYLKTNYPYNDSLDFSYIEKQYLKEDEKKDYELQISDFNINLLKPRISGMICDKIYKSEQIEIINNFYLPIYINSMTYMPYIELEKEYTIEEAKTILQSRLNLYIEKLEENNIQILSNDVIFKEDESRLFATGDIYVAEKNGEKSYFDEKIRRQTYNEYFTEEDGDTP